MGKFIYFVGHVPLPSLHTEQVLVILSVTKQCMHPPPFQLSRQTCSWVAVAPQGEISTYVVPASKWIDFISINYGSTSRRHWND